MLASLCADSTLYHRSPIMKAEQHSPSAFGQANTTDTIRVGKLISQGMYDPFDPTFVPSIQYFDPSWECPTQVEQDTDLPNHGPQPSTKPAGPFHTHNTSARPTAHVLFPRLARQTDIHHTLAQASGIITKCVSHSGTLDPDSASYLCQALRQAGDDASRLEGQEDRASELSILMNLKRFQAGISHRQSQLLREHGENALGVYHILGQAASIVASMESGLFSGQAFTAVPNRGTICPDPEFHLRALDTELAQHSRLDSARDLTDTRTSLARDPCYNCTEQDRAESCNKDYLEGRTCASCESYDIECGETLWEMGRRRLANKRRLAYACSQ